MSKDSERQRTALSLLEELAPETGLKLLQWAKSAKVILPQNQTESKKVESRLDFLKINGRFRIFLHTGSVKGRPVPELTAIKSALESQGFNIVGIDDKYDIHGPGIDYFNDADKTGAANVAEAINALLPSDTSKISVRRQSVGNRVGTLGLWF